jgi:hypothetical protein
MVEAGLVSTAPLLGKINAHADDIELTEFALTGCGWLR